MRLTAKDLLDLKLVDGIISEPLGGAHKDYDGAAAAIKKVILSELSKMEKMTTEELVNQRYERFRRIEFFAEKNVPEGNDECPVNA